MDKVNEIMNELNDMANFKGFGESEEEILNPDGSRNWQANILLDNVKRLEQENAELKAELQKFKDMAKKGLEEFKDVGGCWGCGLQLQLNQDMEDIKKLKAENDELKHSNENLRLALKTYEMPEVVKVLTDWRTGELDLRINKYKQTLQEIKAIAEDAYENESEYQATGVYNEIIQKITKAESEG